MQVLSFNYIGFGFFPDRSHFGAMIFCGSIPAHQLYTETYPAQIADFTQSQFQSKAVPQPQ
jgi:hypothetical protein